ncbi:polyprenyl synthetase family protein [Streptomyces sp. NPDC023838]|uniref:polyprenyl synthetase family protein n=1 Tax=Streptomyces sp. NPDC023838 TaxID=3154325 RepID=UPI0033E6F7D2
MRDQPDIGRRVDRVLREFVDEESVALLDIGVELTPVVEQLRHTMAAGKRLRAAFCYWGWRACGQPDSDAMVKAAAAMELVHAAAVVHDDLIDDSATRRGAPTAHVALRDAVGGHQRSTDGRALAMLVGDLLMSWAGELFTTCGLPAAYLARARPLWATLARELVAGECLEILRARQPACPTSSLEIIRYKTAKYTVEHPLHIGARLGGAPARLLDVFSAYGVPLGEAFQLRDDLLGVFGDPRETGKSNTDDLVGAKPTALLALTLSGATPAERTVLHEILGRRDLGTADFDRAREIMQRSGAPARVEGMISERVEAATAALRRIPLPPEAGEALSTLVTAAVNRAA